MCDAKPDETKPDETKPNETVTEGAADGAAKNSAAAATVVGAIAGALRIIIPRTLNGYSFGDAWSSEADENGALSCPIWRRNRTVSYGRAMNVPSNSGPTAFSLPVAAPGTRPDDGSRPTQDWKYSDDQIASRQQSGMGERRIDRKPKSYELPLG